MIAATISLLLQASSSAAQVDPFDAAAASWRDCIDRQIQTWSPLSDPAEVLAQAALGKCRPWEKDVRRALVAKGDAPSAVAIDQVIADARSMLQERALYKILDARSAATRPR